MRISKGVSWIAASVLMLGLGGCCDKNSPLGVSTASGGGGPAAVNLGTASTFRVLAGSTVTNTGLTTVAGDLGVSPGSAVVGFPPGTVTGTIFTVTPGPAATAQTDLGVAYTDVGGRPNPISVSGDLTGLTLAPGLYASTSSLAVSGAMTLNALGNQNAVFIIRSATTLTTGPGSQIILSGGAKASNIIWWVGSSATLGTNSIFQGTIMANQAITLNTGARLHGSALAQVAAVTLDTNAISLP